MNKFTVMEANVIKLAADELERVLLPRLNGRVFHVTTRQGYEGVYATGEIKNNRTEEFPFTFGQSGNSYGRCRGYVCLFDLREIEQDQLVEALLKYYFLNPNFAENNPFFLFLDEKFHGRLIGSSQAAREQAFSEMWIPNVECWFPGDISLEAISEVLQVEVHQELTPLTEAVLKAWQTKPS